MVYREDPWGDLFEIYSHSYELIYSAGAYQGAADWPLPDWPMPLPIDDFEGQ